MTYLVGACGVNGCVHCQPVVKVSDQGNGIAWLRIRATREEAREMAETFGRIVESDVAEDGRQSFAVELAEE